jgi:hypothetical protein
MKYSKITWHVEHKGRDPKGENTDLRKIDIQNFERNIN